MNAAANMIPQIREEYDRYTLATSIRNSKVACVLVALLMPLGTLMDRFVYPPEAGYFFELRLGSSVMAGLVYFGLRLKGLSNRHYRVLCTGWYLVPAFFICCMIQKEGGLGSSYYAGLNLVILAVSSVIQATLMESVIAVSAIFFMYIAVCSLSASMASGWGKADSAFLANNTFFLFCTAAIVITGNFFYNRLRFREFCLRYELNQSRSMLEASNEKLKELDQVKNRFFANISHELRTPLTLLLSPLESMIHSRGRQFDADTRGLFSIMHGNGMRLLKLINDLLDLVRLESGRMEVKREPLEMSAFIRGLSGAAHQMAEAKGLRLETTVDPGLGPLLVDRDKLEKTLLNLLFNALKFTPKGGTVTLQVKRQLNQLLITVQDTGVGISEKNLPFVFDRFWQADNSSKRKYQGVGIGLSLVKELTEIQEGRVAVESQEGRGTTFIVSLPFLPASGEPLANAAEPTAGTEPAKEPAAPAQSEEWLANLYRRAELFPALTPGVENNQPVGEARNGDRSTLLVADDEPDMLRFLKSQLHAQYDVLEAVDGLQAVEKAGALLPDVILLDMNMPEKDGLQVCRELREQTATASIPIIMLTARADEETKLTALSAGANDFLAKPFSTSELHVRIKNLLESHLYKEKLAKQNQVLATTIDQLKETETLLVQTEKMVSLGRMSAGIIHEINNPLNYATTGLYTLRNKAKYLAPEQQAEYSEVLKDVEEGIGRVKNIVSGLRNFTHPDTDQVEPVDVREILGSALKFLSNEWRDKVLIEQKLDGPFLVQANRNKLLQVFVNLLQNSLDAVRRKTYPAGELPAIQISGRREAGKNVLRMRDNGEGIAPDALGKIFDPFFTTKDVGEGMGLGLSICYRIIQDFQGQISVQSERGKFCEFKLEFPAEQ